MIDGRFWISIKPFPARTDGEVIDARQHAWPSSGCRARQAWTVAALAEIPAPIAQTEIAPTPAPVPAPVAVEAPVSAAPVWEHDRARFLPSSPSDEDGTLSVLEPVAAFFAQARAQMDVWRDLVDLIQDTTEQAVRQEMIAELFLGVHLLSESATASSQHSISLIASSLENLLKKLLENPANIAPSTLPAIATAAELLHQLCHCRPMVAATSPIQRPVVDDDPVALRALSNTLQMRFSKPESASDGKSALALAADKRFDVIFLDVQMPDLDGFEVCARIRENSANRRTPVVFMTGHDAPALREKSEECGGNDFFSPNPASAAKIEP